MVETCEKRNQIPECVLSLVGQHDSEEKEERGGEKKQGEERRGRRTKEHRKGCSQWLSSLAGCFYMTFALFCNLKH